jgi:hypothetical protein
MVYVQCLPIPARTTTVMKQAVEVMMYDICLILVINFLLIRGSRSAAVDYVASK